MDFPLISGKRNELDPRKLKLSDEAKAAWIGFHDEAEQWLRPDGLFASIKEFANKAPEHAARLAAGLALVDELDCKEVSIQHMQAGIRLTKYYMGEARRLFAAGMQDERLLQVERLLNWLQERSSNRVILTEIYQLGPTAFRTAQSARTAMNTLVEHGWARPIPGGIRYCGKKYKEAWQIRRDSDK